MTQINDIITNEDAKLYAETAIWCNQNNAVLEEIEPENGKRRFQVKAIPEPTIEEKQFKVRQIRNQYLVNYVDPKQLVLVWDSLDEQQKQYYTNYRQYLLDYPEAEGWYEQPPKTFEEWKEKSDKFQY